MPMLNTNSAVETFRAGLHLDLMSTGTLAAGCIAFIWKAASHFAAAVNSIRKRNRVGMLVFNTVRSDEMFDSDQ